MGEEVWKRTDTWPLPETEMRKKTPALAVTAGGETRLLPLPEIAAGAGDEGAWQTRIGGRTLEIVYRDDPPCAFVEPATHATVIPSFWFAWAAMEAVGG